METVTLHEAGHGLSQAYFGKVWLEEDGSLMASPRAVMNALYAAPFRSLAGSDDGGHCSNWAAWPNNRRWLTRTHPDAPTQSRAVAFEPRRGFLHHLSVLTAPNA